MISFKREKVKYEKNPECTQLYLDNIKHIKLHNNVVSKTVR